jgi:hypothetical protein
MAAVHAQHYLKGRVGGGDQQQSAPSSTHFPQRVGTYLTKYFLFAFQPGLRHTRSTEKNEP